MIAAAGLCGSSLAIKREAAYAHLAGVIGYFFFCFAKALRATAAPAPLPLSGAVAASVPMGCVGVQRREAKVAANSVFRFSYS